MATAKERAEFIARMQKELPHVSADQVAHLARLVLRHAHTHGRLAVESCNGHPVQSMSPPQGCNMVEYNARVNRLQDAWDKRIELGEKRAEARITELCKPFGIVPDFQGDPRGYTVKLKLPSGAYNNLGGEGWGVPQ